MRSFEDIVGLMHGNGPGSSTLEQHCSAMRMDAAYAWAANQVSWAIAKANPAGNVLV